MSLVLTMAMLLMSAQTAEPEAATTEEPAAVTAAAAPAENPEDELICRRRVVEGNGVGRRLQSVRVCKTRAEWAERAPPRRR